MTRSLLLGVDVGTTGVRSILFDDTLRVVASAYRECPPAYHAGGVAEQDPEEWLDALVATTRAATEGRNASRVVGLAISSQGITLVPVDADDRAVRPALSWLDGRGGERLAELASAMDPAELRSRSWKPFLGVYTLPKVLWLRHHEPEAWQRVRALLTPHDFLVARLTGRRVTDPSLAGGTMAFDVADAVWHPGLHDALGLDRGLWPTVVPAGTAVGALLPGAAARLGLQEGVVVAVGGQDQKVAALAAGLAPGVMTVSLGTAAALTVLQDRPGAPAAADVAGFGYPTGRGFVQEASIATAGAALRWLAGVLGAGASFDDLTRDAAATYPAREWPLFLPYLGAAPDGGGPAGGFWGLRLDASRGDLVRAVVEGVAFELERLRAAMAPDAGVLRAFGGGASGSFWCRVIADVTRARVEVLETHEAAAAGAALLAGQAAGLWPDAAAAAGRVRVADAHDPDPEAAECVGARFARWSELCDNWRTR